MKISLAFVHKYLISYSASWTGFPGRLPRTMKKKPKVSELMELWLTTKQQKKSVWNNNNIDGFKKQLAFAMCRVESTNKRNQCAALHHHMQHKQNRHQDPRPKCPVDRRDRRKTIQLDIQKEKEKKSFFSLVDASSPSKSRSMTESRSISAVISAIILTSPKSKPFLSHVLQRV